MTGGEGEKFLSCLDGPDDEKATEGLECVQTMEWSWESVWSTRKS